jgi:hypothetical protein
MAMDTAEQISVLHIVRPRLPHLLRATTPHKNTRRYEIYCHIFQSRVLIHLQNRQMIGTVNSVLARS